MKKKITISFLSVIILCLTLVGCVGAKKDTDGMTVEANEKVVLKLWTIATESDAFNAPFLQAIADYEKAHPDIKIEMTAYDNQAYKTKIRSAVAANELPDIFFTWGGGFSKTFAEAGKALPLDEYYVSYKHELSEASLSYATFDGVLYGTTYVAPVSMLFYNKKIFEEEGLQAPTTWEELVDICRVLKEDGITPIALSAKDAWVLAMTHDALALKSAGPTKVQQALTKDGQSYDDPDFLMAANKFRELIDMEAFSQEASVISNDEAQSIFTEGNAAMYIMASWTGGVIATDADNIGDFDVVPMPVLSDKAATTDFIGGAVDTLMVNSATEDKDLAANAAFEIARSVSKYAFLEGLGIATWKIDYDTGSVNALSAKIADYTNGATSFTLWFDTLMEAEDAAEYLNLLQQLYANEIDAKGFVERMDKQLSKK